MAPTTLRRIQGSGMPSFFERLMTLMTMARAGATVKTAVPMAMRLSLSMGMPISLPCRQAFRRKYTDWASTISTMIPASRNRTG